MKATIASTLRSARDHLAATSASPDLDARLLLAHVTNLSTSKIIIHGDRLLDDTLAQEFQALVMRRVHGEPVAYIVGHVGFWTLELQVSPCVLIPRPDTETIVETALRNLPATQPLRVADLGTGSGAIALALASERPAWRITATDISKSALACAQDNAAALGISNIEFVWGDWFTALAGRHFAAIISNPPYIAPHDHHLRASELTHEPKSALISNRDGIADLATIINGAWRYMEPGAWLCVEHGATQGELVQSLFGRAGFVRTMTVHDLGGNERGTHGRKNKALEH